MTMPAARVERRVERTRQLLQQAFMAVIQEKGFAATSIQDVAARANVNRGTFYLHFEDKYQLLDTVVRDQFHQHLASALPSTPRWDRPSLRQLIQAVMLCFEHKYRHQPAHPPVPIPLLEQAMHEELTELLATWLRQEPALALGEKRPLEVIAQITSWAIFGPAVQWSQAPITRSLEQMTDDILLVITEGVMGIIAETTSN